MSLLPQTDGLLLVTLAAASRPSITCQDEAEAGLYSLKEPPAACEQMRHATFIKLEERSRSH